MSYSEINTKIKKRLHPKDVFYTPEDLAQICINDMNIQPEETAMDPFYGRGVFYCNFPECKQKYFTEIEMAKDFFDHTEPVDVICSNPPYSILDRVLEHTCKICTKRFGYLLNWNALTTKRLEKINEAGFGLVSMHMCKIFSWFGMSAFMIFEKDKKNIVKYNRKVYRGT